MAIYEIDSDKLIKMPETSFATEGIRERDDLQRLLREQIEVIAPDTLVISEEFGHWEDSRRRIDLLGLDKDANLVVIELKRTEDGGHMELQAIRYAAMVSSLTFRKVVEVFGSFLTKLGKEDDPESLILEFLDWNEVNEEEFAQDVKIVLASAEFSKELTTAVIWLNNSGLDVKCIRLKPYKDGKKTLLDIQQVIPLPEAEDYQVKIRDKTRLEKVSRSQGRDLSKYDVTVGEAVFENMPKRGAIFTIVKYLCDQGIDPEELLGKITWRNDVFCVFDGQLDNPSFVDALTKHMHSKGKQVRLKRYFIEDDELIYANGKTYAFNKLWSTRTNEAMDILISTYSDKKILYDEKK
ncbi:MAG: hypothetical protein OEZ10_14045 [Gammaproteobacteria bacterium]|nr:hypothetical protein [Gammaproteobacteria bacterium]